MEAPFTLKKKRLQGVTGGASRQVVLWHVVIVVVVIVKVPTRFRAGNRDTVA